MASWVCLRCTRFVASIAGDGISGLPRKQQTADKEPRCPLLAEVYLSGDLMGSYGQSRYIDLTPRQMISCAASPDAVRYAHELRNHRANHDRSAGHPPQCSSLSSAPVDRRRRRALAIDDWKRSIRLAGRRRSSKNRTGCPAMPDLMYCFQPVFLRRADPFISFGPQPISQDSDGIPRWRKLVGFSRCGLHVDLHMAPCAAA